MIEPWKQLSLLAPPVHTFKCKSNIDIKDLKHVCYDVNKVLSKQSPLHKESAILSRFLYKFDKKFRTDIGYRNIKKINSSLKKYLQMNLMKDIQSFLSVLPSEDDDYLPTRQMLEYVLVRLLTFSKLMQRICVLCKQAAIFYLNRIKLGESHWMSLMPYALLSRIWSMTLVLLQHTCKWYSNLKCYLNKLQLKGLQFLPDNYILPADLEKWIDLKNLDNLGRLEWSQKKNIPFEYSLIADDGGDSFENILEYVNHINDEEILDTNVEVVKPISEELNIIKEQNHPTKVDQGIVVSRESFKMLTTFQSKINNEKYKHQFEKVTNGKTLKAFINKEEEFRNESNGKSLTSHLSLMQWHALKKCLVKMCNPMSKDRKLQRKLMRIWKEKCLSYK